MTLIALMTPGCSGDETDDVARTEPAPGTTAEQPCPPEREQGGTFEGVLDVDVDGPLVTGSTVTWRLRLQHTGGEAQTLVFSSGQEGDAVLVAGDDVVHRWSDGRVFSQAVRCRVVDPGETLTLELGDDTLDVPPGRYELTATVAAQPAPAPATVTVEVEG